MTVSYAIPTEYEFSFGYGATDICAIAPSILSLTSRNINPENLHDFALKHEESLVPEGSGAYDLSDGNQAPVTINFYGEQYAEDQEDLFTDLAAKLANLSNSTPERYLLAGLYDGTSKILFRRYGKVLGASVSYVRKTRYSFTRSFEMALRVLDPYWYFNTARTQTVTITTGTTNNAATSDTGLVRSKRLLIKITRTAATPTNVTVSNNSGQSFTLTGTLAANGDYWLVDMMNGTVVKATSGGTVLTDDIGSFSGMFWGIKPTTDTITVTSMVSCSLSCVATWLERRS